ncbi:hypothetical protein [Roseiconus nitratireducens]|uniref:hypothetical protein n=1 Tax=Roseiconus nitratireducens TaxID=2605748 RepID=UPI0013755EE7|nr:hypothetical protein [Roseiconus nitratireducens]
MAPLPSIQLVDGTICRLVGGTIRLHHSSLAISSAQRMTKLNPYSPPRQVESAAPPVPETSVVPPYRGLALCFLAASVVFSLTYTWVDEVTAKTSNGAWPMLFITCFFAVLAGFSTRDRIIAPLTCFAGVMSGDVLAGLIRGWAYAQLHLCVPLATAFSVPALASAIIAHMMERKRHQASK